jgi:3-oxoacyl-(acyl-carrier-protein) synthase
VITGLGAVTPLGNNVRSSWDQLMAGKGAAGPITAFDTTGYAVTFACDAKDFEATQWIQRKQARRMDRFAQMIRGGGARDPPRARIYAELAGCGVSSDAQHLTEPDPSGQSQVCAMRMAFADGGISPDEIDYISWTGRTELRRGGLCGRRVHWRGQIRSAIESITSHDRIRTGDLLGASSDATRRALRFRA